MFAEEVAVAAPSVSKLFAALARATQATNDKLVKQLRKLLREKHGFPKEYVGSPRSEPWGVPCVFGDEKALDPEGEVGLARSC